MGTLRFQGHELAGAYVGITDRPTFLNAQAIARVSIDAYSSERVDQVTSCYNGFKSAMEQVLSRPGDAAHPGRGRHCAGPRTWTRLHMDFIFEPSAE